MAKMFIAVKNATLSQFAGKIAYATGGRVLHMSPAGALIQSANQRMVSIPGPAESYRWREEAQIELNRERLYFQRFGFAYFQSQGRATR